MDRRDLLRTIGYGSAAAAVPSLLGACQQAATDGRTTFLFVAVSGAKTVAGVKHQIVMRGQGKFSASEVEGSGAFIHFNDAPPAPKPVIEAGTWQAKRFVSFTEKELFEGIRAGILEILIDLQPTGKPAVAGATLRVVCNIGFRGISTGQPEGYFLTIPGVDYGTFEPQAPAVGLTHIGNPT